MRAPRHLTILGAGPAGLAAGFYARQAGLPFTIYEASSRIGGNAITFRHGAFLFDSGAHRLHDKHPDVTRDLQALLGDDLKRVDAPSAIYLDGQYVNFPLSPGNLLRHLGAPRALRAGLDLLRHRIGGRPRDASLESLAVHAYGRTIASAFLLNYSEKLWGLPASRLAESAAGSRLRALQLRSVLMAALGFGNNGHYEGAFFYPRLGIGQIADRLGTACGMDNIVTEARITGVRHDGQRVTDIQVGSAAWTPVDTVISTLPVDLMIGMMSPAASTDATDALRNIHYRSLVLVTLSLAVPSITSHATVYFPGRDFPFTRISEPRNRSAEMAPPGHTSLLVEVPGDHGDSTWAAPDDATISRVVQCLVKIGWIRPADVVDAHVTRLSHAYPVAAVGLDTELRRIAAWLAPLGNLHLLGRNAEFRYTWIHELVASGRKVIDEIRRT